MPKPKTTQEDQHLFAGWSLDHFLDRLPIFAIAVGRKFPDDVSDDVLQAWSDGISDVSENVKKLIAEWRLANGK